MPKADPPPRPAVPACRGGQAEVSNTMKIGVVADTHSREIPGQLIDDFREVDFIVHAGDFCSLKDFKIFSSLGHLKAVYGNMDDPALRRLLPRREIFEISGQLIGLVHGDGAAQTVIDYVTAQFKNEHVSTIIFGHSHQPCNKRIKDILYFNPGSPNDLIIAPYCSYGILEIKENQVTGKIIKVKK